MSVVARGKFFSINGKPGKLEKVDQYIDIKLDVSGPLRDALEVIDSKPLQYAREVGIDPAAVDGMADARLAFKHDESPRRQLAVIGHPRADGHNGFQFGRRRAGSAHLARFHRAADFQQFEGVGH